MISLYVPCVMTFVLGSVEELQHGGMCWRGDFCVEKKPLMIAGQKLEAECLEALLEASQHWDPSTAGSTTVLAVEFDGCSDDLKVLVAFRSYLLNKARSMANLISACIFGGVRWYGGHAGGINIRAVQVCALVAQRHDHRVDAVTTV